MISKNRREIKPRKMETKKVSKYKMEQGLSHQKVNLVSPLMKILIIINLILKFFSLNLTKFNPKK